MPLTFKEPPPIAAAAKKYEAEEASLSIFISLGLFSI